MKKITALILALMMACMMIPAMAEEDVTGEWYLNQIAAGETVMDPSAFGMSGTLTLNADGTFAMNVTGMDGGEGTWKTEDGKIILTAGEDSIEAVLADGKLALEAIGLVFSKEAPAAGYTPAEVKTDAKLEDFAGNWGVAYIGVNDTIMDLNAFVSLIASMLGQDAESTLASSIVTMTIDGTKVTTGAGTAQEETIEATFADGKLIVKPSEDGLEIPIVMLQDGNLVIDSSMGGMPAILYFVPAAAEETPAA